VAVDGSGNVYLTSEYDRNGDPGGATFGTTTLAAGGTGYGSSLALSKLDGNGNWLWTERLSGSLGQLTGLTVNAGGNVYVGGSFLDTTNSSFLAKYDPNGQALWTDLNAGGALTGTGNLVPSLATYQDPVTGATSLYAVGNRGIVQKLDAASGAVLWSEVFGSQTIPLVRAVAVDAGGNLDFTGQFSGSANFDPGPGTAYLTSAGGYDGFLLKLDPSGNLLSARRFGGAQNDGGSGLALDSSGNVYTAGTFQGTVGFDTGSQIVSLTSSGSTSLFLAKTTQDRGAILGQVFNDLNNNGAYDPSGSNAETGIPGRTVSLYDGTGALVATAVTGSQGQYEFDHLLPGSYTVRQILPGGWTQTTPANNAGLPVSVTAGASVGSVLLGAFTPNTIRSYSNTTAVGTSARKPNAVSAMTIADPNTIFDLKLTLTVSNGKNQPLTVTLKGPDGTVVTLASSTVLNGTVTFETPAFDYKAVKGTWTLEVDGLAGGSLNSWSLGIDESNSY
jgi:hypothetical protein